MKANDELEKIKALIRKHEETLACWPFSTARIETDVLEREEEEQPQLAEVGREF